MPELDPILDAWLIDPANPPAAQPLATPAEPAETHLLSTQESGASQASVNAYALHQSANVLQGLTAEVRTSIQAAINATADERVPKPLQLAAALEQVQARWGEKLAHLTGNMDEYVGKLHGNANEWVSADETNAGTLTVI